MCKAGRKWTPKQARAGKAGCGEGLDGKGVKKIGIKGLIFNCDFASNLVEHFESNVFENVFLLNK